MIGSSKVEQAGKCFKRWKKRFEIVEVKLFNLIFERNLLEIRTVIFCLLSEALPSVASALSLSLPLTLSHTHTHTLSFSLSLSLADSSFVTFYFFLTCRWNKSTKKLGSKIIWIIFIWSELFWVSYRFTAPKGFGKSSHWPKILLLFQDFLASYSHTRTGTLYLSLSLSLILSHTHTLFPHHVSSTTIMRWNLGVKSCSCNNFQTQKRVGERERERERDRVKTKRFKHEMNSDKGRL